MTTSSLSLIPLHTLAWDIPNWVMGLLIVGFGAVCGLLVLAILIQKPQGGGLSGAFGAGASGSGQTAFGTKTGDALTWMTIIIFVVYLGAAIGMNYTMRPASSAPTLPAAGSPPAGGTAPPASAPAEKPAEPQTGTTPPATSTINVKPPEGGSTPAPANPGTNPSTPAPANPAPTPVTPPLTPPTTPETSPPAPATNPPAAPPATPR